MYSIVRQKLKTSDPAIGRDVLILFTYWFAQFFDLDTAGLLGQFSRLNRIFA